MAWKPVKIKIGKATYDQYMDDNIIQVNAEFPEAESYNVNGKDLKVLAVTPYADGAMKTIEFQMESQAKKEKSDDSKQAKG